MKEQTLRKQRQRRSVWLDETEGKNEPVLRFSPTAWAKLVYFRDKTDNEIGGFAITEPTDLLYVKEFVTVKQRVSPVSVKFDDQAVADFFDDQVDLGRKPEQFSRIWLHSHPGSSPEPSAIDEETFGRVFGGCYWAVMFIVAQDNKTYVRLAFNTGPGGQILIPVAIDYSRDFGPSNHELWDAEYTTNVEDVDWLNDQGGKKQTDAGSRDWSRYALPYDFMDEFELMDPQERRFILDELAGQPDLWNEEEEVMSL